MTFIKKIKSSITKILVALLHLLPKQDKVVFENFRGRGMGDDPKYIALALLKLKKNQKIKLVWLTTDLNIELPEGIIPVKYKSLRSIYELATSKVWVYNTKDGYKIAKGKGQFYIQTWHGTIGIKKVEKEANLSLKSQRYLAKDASMTDLMYSNNDISLELFKSSFWYNGPVLKCDVPRISVLLNVPNNLKDKIYSYYHLDINVKIILYAPTFRNSDSIDVYKFNYQSILESAETHFGGKFVLLLRLHPKMAKYSENFSYSNRVIGASDYPDMQELLAVSDILISDFSSSIFDFGITKKPVCLYIPDYKNYLEQDRGLCFKLDEIPFIKAFSEQELCDSLQTLNMAAYSKSIGNFYSKIGYNDSGNGDKALANIILKKLRN